MTDTLTLRAAAELMQVSRTNTIRELLDRHADGGYANAVAGYDAMGRALVRRDVVEPIVKERASRGAWRAKNLGSWVERSPRSPNDARIRLCLHRGCETEVQGRRRFCPRHERAALKPKR